MPSRHSARAFALVVLTCQVLFAQQYNFQYFGIAEGLTNLAVRQVYQDRAGFLWVSTENGIFRYDGERFEGFGPAQGIPATSGAAFGDAPDGSLLVGGDFGLYQQSGTRFSRIVPAAGTVNWAQGIQSDGKGHTFVGTDTGLMELSLSLGRNQFEVRRFPQVPGTSGPEVYGIAVDDGIIWYGCGLELCRMGRNGTCPIHVRRNHARSFRNQMRQPWYRIRDHGQFSAGARSPRDALVLRRQIGRSKGESQPLLAMAKLENSSCRS
jgi:hypothetical protein